MLFSRQAHESTNSQSPFLWGSCRCHFVPCASLNTWFLPVSSFFVHLSSHEAMPMAAENETLKPCSFCTLHFLLAGALKSRDRVQLWLGGRGLADVGKALCSTPRALKGEKESAGNIAWYPGCHSPCIAVSHSSNGVKPLSHISKDLASTSLRAREECAESSHR